MNHKSEFVGGALIGVGICLWAPGMIDLFAQLFAVAVVVGSFAFMAVRNSRVRDSWTEDQL